MWSGSIGQWPSEIFFAKIQQALRITCKGVKLVKIGQWPFPKNSKTSWRSKTECHLEPNLAKWGGSYCNKSEVEVMSFISLNRVWACWLPLISMSYSKQKVKKKLAKLERKYYFQNVLKFNVRTSFYVLKFDLRTLFYELEFNLRTVLKVLQVNILNSST